MTGHSPILTRHAEAFFWMARYVERAENIARIVDATQTFGHDPAGTTNWLPVVQINADRAAFQQAYAELTPKAVQRFYLIDQSNPTSAVFAVKAARENARLLRAMISTELWTQINIFYHELTRLRSADIAGANLSRVCGVIRESCQTHFGIIDGTAYRGPGWYLYQCGRFLERADQSTRLLDIKYHHLLPSLREVGSQVDVNQWHSLLRAAGAYHAYRRVYPRGLAPAEVAGFLLFETGFPRSVLFCAQLMARRLGHLQWDFGLAADHRLDDAVAKLMGMLSGIAIDQVIANGLHEYLDGVQRQLIAVSDAISAAYFTLDSQAA